MPNGRRWGEDALWPVRGHRIACAARNAFLDPQTLVPLAGTAILLIDDLDGRASDWMLDHHPVFGSASSASHASDELVHALRFETIATVLATPSGSQPGPWLAAKARGAAVEAIAAGVTIELTAALKPAIDRVRPNGKEHSFPSGHSTTAFSFATLSNRNARSAPFLRDAYPVVVGANLAVASLVAIARVEGAHHFPADVLAGAAVGHFMTAFIHDAFMGIDGGADCAIYLEPHGGAVALTLRF